MGNAGSNPSISKIKKVDVVRSLVESFRLDPNHIYEDGTTPLHQAPTEEIFCYLLESKAIPLHTGYNNTNNSNNNNDIFVYYKELPTWVTPTITLNAINKQIKLLVYPQYEQLITNLPIWVTKSRSLRTICYMLQSGYNQYLMSYKNDNERFYPLISNIHNLYQDESYNNKDIIRILQLLISAKADPTYLLQAPTLSNDAIQFLIDKKANPRTYDLTLRTALAKATNSSVIYTLLKANADPDAKDYNKTYPILEYTEKDDYNSVLYLINAKVSLNVQSILTGYYPIHMASYNLSNTISLLCNTSDINVNIHDNNGNMSILYALYSHHEATHNNDNISVFKPFQSLSLPHHTTFPMVKTSKGILLDKKLYSCLSILFNTNLDLNIHDNAGVYILNKVLNLHLYNYIHIFTFGLCNINAQIKNIYSTQYNGLMLYDPFIQYPLIPTRQYLHLDDDDLCDGGGRQGMGTLFIPQPLTLVGSNNTIDVDIINPINHTTTTTTNNNNNNDNTHYSGSSYQSSPQGSVQGSIHHLSSSHIPLNIVHPPYHEQLSLHDSSFNITSSLTYPSPSPVITPLIMGPLRPSRANSFQISPPSPIIEHRHSYNQHNEVSSSHLTNKQHSSSPPSPLLLPRDPLGHSNSHQNRTPLNIIHEQRYRPHMDAFSSASSTSSSSILGPGAAAAGPGTSASATAAVQPSNTTQHTLQKQCYLSHSATNQSIHPVLQDTLSQTSMTTTTIPTTPTSPQSQSSLSPLTPPPLKKRTTYKQEFIHWARPFSERSHSTIPSSQSVLFYHIYECGGIVCPRESYNSMDVFTLYEDCTGIMIYPFSP